ncbi:ATP-binding cassette domain-containing protein [Parapusillimonas granuli]|uniref:ATP-binding protein Uup n=1 Tax=Parapusillimonas granuli TaxID=380911 RepID=A0A853FVU0_9BURK|nr:ATP-binding cassette domain-containing protein [Parapusillimonas granuli]MBB5213898.1 ATP-binding cassette subfamily F protein uup [Parapusillimonas granuli]MEB2398977.1 ATP-binding cassette domain-containing protein [Alcaligenaceae bacterium]NYT48733.1 ATP-binding cassette domain-containing protein [Parapusillimonas granuli]
MAAPTLITLSGVQLAYGHHPLLDHADFTIQSGERIGLIGRNGAGKSSLLKILDGRTLPDDGEIMRSGGLKIATVEQEPELDAESTVLDALCGDYAETEDWQRPARANALIEQLNLAPDALIEGLSGGTRKRVALARALADEPDLLLLDEPTNHLDFVGIAWLEGLLQTARCSVIIITHDRRFLDAVATRIVELDRGKLYSFPGNFSQWQQRKAEALEAEKQQNAKFDKFLAQEEVWIRKGVEARRTRNEGRVRRLEQLRRERAARRERQGNVSLAIAEGRRSGKLVAELQHVSHRFGERVIIRDFSTVIMRKDRIGLIGPNGSGKTTLLKIMLGKLPPTSGTVRLGVNLTVGYFDQMRAQLNENATLADTINPGSEWVEIGNQRKHVMSYLEDFLFPPARAQSPVHSLSGGERARLVLARMFARPTNVLVLDEPTNDLDIETLELLEELLQDYPGTVLLVSHDREFLDNVVTQTIAFEGDGRWGEYVGGYDEWLAQRPAAQGLESEKPRKKEAAAPARPKAAKASRITSWELRELDELPDRIAALEREQAALAARLADGDLYREAPGEVEAINSRMHEIEQQLEVLFVRWEALEDKRNDGAAPGATIS